MQKKVEKEQELINILNESYFEARDYWSIHLKEILTKEEFNLLKEML